MATLQHGKTYWIAYCNGQGEASERVIHVQSVSTGTHGTTYIRAFCELAGEERTFRLDRMADIELLDGPLSEATRVTQRRNSSYLGPSQEVARAPSFSAPTPAAPVTTAPIVPSLAQTAPNAQAAPIATAPASATLPQRTGDVICPVPQTARDTATERGYVFWGLLLKAVALFILFDFVLTDDPGSMSTRFIESVESVAGSYDGLDLPEPVTSLWEYNEPEPTEVWRPEPTEAENLATTFNVSASRVREGSSVEQLDRRAPAKAEREYPLPPAGWTRVSCQEYQGAAIDLLVSNGVNRYHVPRTGVLYTSLQEAREEIRLERLERKGEVTDELVISRYEGADLNGDDELSWYELKVFQRKVSRDFSYQSNKRALRPEEFFVAAGGDCEDFAIFSTAMLTYWGWDAYVASMGTNAENAHAVTFIKVDRAPDWATVYEIPVGTGDPRFVVSGTFVPVDYDVVGGVSTAVTPGSRVTDIVVVNAWYGLPI